MKAAMLSFVLLAVTGLAWGQEVAPGPPQAFVANVPVTATVVGKQAVEIEGPETVTPGQPVQFVVNGLSEDVLPETDVTWFPRDGVTCVLATTWPDKATIIWFVAGVAPEYLVKLNAPDGLSAEIVVNTKGAPVPPPPDPTPGPTPPPVVGLRTVLIVHESGELSAAFAQQLEAVREYTSSQAHIDRVRFLDPDLKGPDGKVPAWFQGYLDLIEKNSLKLPVLMVGVLSSDPEQPLAQLYAEELPDTAADIIQAVKKYGG